MRIRFSHDSVLRANSLCLELCSRYITKFRKFMTVSLKNLMITVLDI